MGRQRSAKRRGWPDHLYDNGNGYFYYVSPINGERKGLGRDRATAFHEAKAANAIVAAMKQPKLAAWVQGRKDHTLTTWLPIYEEIWVKEETPAEGTLDAARRYFVRINQMDIAGMRIADIHTEHVATALDKLLSESTPSVVVNIRARLMDIFRIAITKGLLRAGENPVTDTKPPKYTVKRERLSLEQFLAIRAKVPKWAANAMDLALLTAQRREDLVNMQFADVREGYLFIVQGKTGMKLQQDINIRLDAVNMSIADVIKSCRDRIVSKYLIHHPRTRATYRAGDPVTGNGLADAFATARDELKIVASVDGKTPPTLHEIRSLAERLYLQQYGAEFAQSMLGHKHARMTAEYNDLRGSGWAVVTAK